MMYLPSIKFYKVMASSLPLLLGLVLFAANVQAQDSPKIKKNEPIAGILFGGNMVQFYRANSEVFKFPQQNPLWQWQVGISVDAIHTRWYALRWELVYNNKGAREVFKDDFGTSINSKAHLSYAQINFIPLIIKPLGHKTFNPYLAVGGYYSYLIKSKYEVQINGLGAVPDDIAVTNTLKQDYGINVSLGLYIKKISLEYRVEAGIPQILDQQKTLSSIRNKTHSIILIIR